MPNKRAAAKPDDKNVAPSYAKPSTIFHSMRQRMWFGFFTLWFIVDVAELGLVSQQIHTYSGQNYANWPNEEVGNGMGLLLFSTLFGLLICLFHWALSLRLYLPIMVAVGCFFGAGAGILYQTPFGHGPYECKGAVENIPAAFQPFYNECTRYQAIEGLAWCMFGLAIIGLFAAYMDQTEVTFTRSDVYDVEVEAEAPKGKGGKGSH